MNASKFPVVSYQSRCVATPEHSLPGYSENYDRVVAFAPGCGEHPFMVYQDPSTHSTTIELFSPFKLIERLIWVSQSHYNVEKLLSAL